MLPRPCLHLLLTLFVCFLFFFFNATATTEIYTLSLHDALPILTMYPWAVLRMPSISTLTRGGPSLIASTRTWRREDRKSTRLNSSHTVISYAVFCLKKKKKQEKAKIDETYIYKIHVVEVIPPRA